MNSFFRNGITKLYNAVSAPVVATRDAVSERLQNVRDSVSSLYHHIKTYFGYGQETLYYIVQNEAEREEDEEYKGLQDIKHLFPKNQDKKEKGVEDIQYIFDEHDIKMIAEGNRCSTWRATENLNVSLTDGIMHKITPDINMRTKIVYSFKCEIHRGGGDVVDYAKVKSSNGTLTSIEEIRDFIEQCEMKRLDLEDVEFWGKAYLPPSKTIDTPGSYEGKVIFTHVQIKIIASNEPLLGCGPLPDWFT